MAPASGERRAASGERRAAGGNHGRTPGIFKSPSEAPGGTIIDTNFLYL
jgi:hypothetical protein